jgi:hypothetical protein
MYAVWRMVPIYYLTVTYGLTGLVKHTYKCFNNALFTNNYNSVETNKVNLDHLLQVAGNMLILSQVTFLATGCDY